MTAAVLPCLFCLFCCFTKGFTDSVRAEDQLRHALFGNRRPIDIHTRPSVHSNQSSHVELGMSLISVVKLDEKTETLHTSIWVRMVWYDYSLHWDEADYDGISVLRISSKLIWKPDIVLENTEEATEATIRGDTLLLIYPTGQVLWVPPKSYRSSCIVQLRDFPFDEHVCQFRFRSWSHDAHTLKLAYYNNRPDIDMADYFTNSEWIVTPELLSTSNESSNRSELAFAVRLKRRGSYYVFTLGVPIILSWGLVLALFWLPPTAGEKVTLGAFALLYHFILLVQLHWIIPHNGTQVPRIVVFCGYSLLFVGLSIVLSITTITMSRNASSAPVPSFVRQLLTGWVGYVFCLGPTRKGVSMGAKLLTSSNVELSLNSEHKEEMLASGGGQQQQQQDSDWTLLATTLDRLFFVGYCIVFVVLLVSTFLS